MKAIVRTSYGSPDVLKLREAPVPVADDNQVLVKVRAASVNPIDWHIMRGEPYLMRLMGYGIRKPKHMILGIDIAGRVEAVGKSITQCKIGDEVFGSAACGGFAEYVCTREIRLVPKPTSLTFEQAAAIPIAAITALQGLRDKGQIQAGQNVLINGASGGVGTFAVQIAKAFGAEVTGVCSTKNAELVRSIGADHVIDYTKENFTRRGQRYDLILDAIGNHSLSAMRRVLSPKGRGVMIGGPTGKWKMGLTGLLNAAVLSQLVGQTFVGFLAKMNNDDLITLSDLVHAGKMVPVIDRQYPLSETAEAIRYVEQGHACGKVIITVQQ